MLISVGAVYRDETRGVDFIAVKETYDAATNDMSFLLINVHNWIVVARLHGKLMPDGKISCHTLDSGSEPASDAPLYSEIAGDVTNYFHTAIKRGV